MGIANSALRASRRQSQDESADNVAVNLVVSSPAPEVSSRHGVSTFHAGARTSPILVDALDDEVQVVSASEVPPLRRSRRTRRQTVTVVDEEVHATREGNKRQRVAAVTKISPETVEGSSLKRNNVVKTSKGPAKVPPKEPIFTCPVCWDKMDEPGTTTCGHIFCTNCIKQAIKKQKKCPTCRKSLKMNNFFRIYLPDNAS